MRFGCVGRCWFRILALLSLVRVFGQIFSPSDFTALRWVVVCYFPSKETGSKISMCRRSLSLFFSRSVMSDPATPWTAALQAPPSSSISHSLVKLMSTESVMPSNHLILCRSLLLPPSIFPSIRVFSSESALPIRWPKYWSFSFRRGLARQ